MQTGSGGYYNKCRQLRIRGNAFENNTASSGAGGLELDLCSGAVEDCTFVKNKVTAHAPHAHAGDHMLGVWGTVCYKLRQRVYRLALQPGLYMSSG